MSKYYTSVGSFDAMRKLAGAKDAHQSHLFSNGKCTQCGCGLHSSQAGEQCPNATEHYQPKKIEPKGR